MKRSKDSFGISDATKIKTVKKFSNSLEDSVKTFCCECGSVTPITGLDEHIATHKMDMEMYRRLYGSPFSQIIELVYHKCGLCYKDLLMDVKSIKRHIEVSHQLHYEDYSGKFFTKPIKRIAISCSHCGKSFNKNIQLKVHLKRHVGHSQSEERAFHGFETVTSNKKTLLKMVNLMEITLETEKWGFQQRLKQLYK